MWIYASKKKLLMNLRYFLGPLEYIKQLVLIVLKAGKNLDFKAI